MITGDNPWLQIPVADYEAHMDAVGQAAALRQLFSSVYSSIRPSRLLVLGCTTGADFDVVDPAVTDVAAGVDINARYLDVAENRLAAIGRNVHLVCGDVLEVELQEAPFDLVHAALLLEYVDPLALFRRVRLWLAPSGHFSVVIQERIPGVAAVTSTGYESLQKLSTSMSLLSAHEVVHLGSAEGFVCESRRALELEGGKVLMQLLFGRTKAARPDTAANATAPRD
jgi:SAM-dependent methyltransferase